MSKIPKLRFKEFSGEWEENELGNIVEISKAKYNPLKSEESYKCVELENLSQETGQLLGYFNSKEQQSIKNKFNRGQVLFGKLRPYLKKYWLADFEGVCSSEIWVLNGKSVSNNFIYRIVQTDKFNFISNISSGSKMPRADWNYMSEFPFFIPSIEEQEKIASFFSLIDDKISLQSEKVEALKDYKKGMMQKIFSSELRFKDDEGRDYPEWEEKKLNELGDFFKGSTLSKSHLANDGKPCVLYGELYTKYGEVINNVVSRTDLEDDKLILGYSNDVLIPSSGETAIDIATASCLLKDDVILGGDLNIFRSSKINGVFLSYQLNNTKKNEISKLAQGASVVHLYNNQLSKLKVDIPCIYEQNKIADFLHNIDKKIEKEQDKLDSLNEYKKGLLQQMFV